jgi:hypothetical protein
MLLIGCAKITKMRELVENYSVNNTNFQVVKQDGLKITVRHNLDDDISAKLLIRGLVNLDPILKTLFITIKIVDEMGNLILTTEAPGIA